MTSVPVAALFLTARDRFHAALKEKVLRLDGGVLSIADKRNKTSKDIAFRINRKIGGETRAGEIKSQKAENEFEVAVAQFICETFVHLQHLRPGPWRVQKGGGEPEKPHEAAWKDELAIDLKQPTGIAGPKKHQHPVAIAKAGSENKEPAGPLGNDYIIKPDILIFRGLAKDEEINRDTTLVDGSVALRSSLRKRNGGPPSLHASIACKLTIGREVLNLMSNPRGTAHHIFVVTGEPLPSRLPPVALGAGGIDHIYHFALPELLQTVKELNLPDSEEALKIMMDAKRLKDIPDLPLDLSV